MKSESSGDMCPLELKSKSNMQKIGRQDIAKLAAEEAWGRGGRRERFLKDSGERRCGLSKLVYLERLHLFSI